MLWQVGRTPIRIKVVVWLLSSSEQESPTIIGVEMPPMTDTGFGKRGTHYYLNDGFGKSKIPNVEFYYYAN